MAFHVCVLNYVFKQQYFTMFGFVVFFCFVLFFPQRKSIAASVS